MLMFCRPSSLRVELGAHLVKQLRQPIRWLGPRGHATVCVVHVVVASSYALQLSMLAKVGAAAAEAGA